MMSLSRLWSKPYLGITLVVIMGLILSNSGNFYYFTETPIGRVMLVAAVVVLSSICRNSGLIAILLIAAAFYFHQTTVHSYNYYSYGAFEGFESKEPAKKQAKEGFCMADKEAAILRGKPSNSVPVFNSQREQTENVMPSDSGVFSSNSAFSI